MPSVNLSIRELAAVIICGEDAGCFSEARLDMFKEQLDANVLEMPAFKGRDLCISLMHECSGSPTGYCIYDEESDPAHDTCLFCGDPYERK